MVQWGFRISHTLKLKVEHLRNLLKHRCFFDATTIFFLEDMSSLFLCSIFIVTITFTLAAQNFVEVSDCPKTADEWGMRSKKKNCLVDSHVYLCAAIQNKLGRYGEICTYQRWIPESKYTCTKVVFN